MSRAAQAAEKIIVLFILLPIIFFFGCKIIMFLKTPQYLKIGIFCCVPTRTWPHLPQNRSKWARRITIIRYLACKLSESPAKSEHKVIRFFEVIKAVAYVQENAASKIHFQGKHLVNTFEIAF